LDSPVSDFLTLSPFRTQEYQTLQTSHTEIVTKLAAQEYPDFEPADGLAIEEVRGNWSRLEKAENDRDEALRMKHELRLMEESTPPVFFFSVLFSFFPTRMPNIAPVLPSLEYSGGAGELSEWIKARIEFNNSRNFPKTSEECLKMAGEEQNFKKTEKVKKGEFKDSLVADHVLIAAKIRKENHPDFKLSDETTPAGLGNLWTQLEKAESERASALAAEQIRIGGQGKLFPLLLFFFLNSC